MLDVQMEGISQGLKRAKDYGEEEEEEEEELVKCSPEQHKKIKLEQSPNLDYDPDYQLHNGHVRKTKLLLDVSWFLSYFSQV